MLTMRVVSLSVLLGAVACTSANVLRLDPLLRPRTNPNSIQLLAREPRQPYTVIAIVSARGRKRLLKEAARVGGDAVLLDISSMSGFDDSITGKVIAFTDSAGGT